MGLHFKIVSAFAVVFFSVTAVVTSAGAQSSPRASPSYFGYGTGANPQSHSRSGYIRRDTGTYVAPYHATNPNGTRLDNYSTRPNYNPYTGRTGTRRW